MKTPKIITSVGHIDDDLICGAVRATGSKRKAPWLKWGSVAACFLVVLTAITAVSPRMSDGRTGTDTSSVSQEGNGRADGGCDELESLYERGYNYRVDNGRFSKYVKGRVIEDSKVEQKLDDVTVTAGWVDAEGNALTEEHARAVIYKIKDVDEEIAVALKFTDKLEAQLTTCYYVIMNPNADLTPVKDYMIVTDDRYKNGDGENGAIPE